MPGRASRKSMPSRSASLSTGLTRMPSGVSHGAALPLGSALAVFSNAISAKFGMRLMAPIIHPRLPGSLHSIMVRILVADDLSQLLRSVILQRGLARQVGDANHPAKPGFGSILPRRHHPVGAVEGPGHDLDPGTVDAAKAQRRTAIPAEVALCDRGRAECRRLALGPGEISVFDIGEGGERCAARFLAHPAMT